VSHPRKKLINGQWVNAQSGRTFSTYNPVVGTVMAQIAEEVDKTDIDLVVRAVRKAFKQDFWRNSNSAPC